MSKFVKSMICILGISSLLLVGCSGADENKNSNNNDGNIATSSDKTENIDSKEEKISSDETEDISNESIKKQEITSTEEAKSEIDESNDNTTTNSTKQLYLDKLNELDANLKISLEEKYASPKTQDMIDAANEEFNQWDYMLNEIYSKLEEQLSQEDMDNLRVEEVNWINTRDLKSKEAAEKYEGGTIAPYMSLISLIDSTKTRCYELVEQFMK